MMRHCRHAKLTTKITKSVRNCQTSNLTCTNTQNSKKIHKTRICMDNDKEIDNRKMHEKNQQLKDCIDLRACSYVNWYHKFHKISLQSVCVPLPDDIVNYLLDEIIVLPKECYAREQSASVAASLSYSGVPSSFDAGDDDSTGTEPEFPAFSRLIEVTIGELGGSAFIKTNWHSPKDAFWITAGQTMCCKDITDVYQLLKASGICKEDLMCHNLPIFETNDVNGVSETNENSGESSIVANANNQYLVFKKWHDIHPGTEFRCFVRNKRIVGISPRDWPQYHEHICAQKVNIINDIVTMFKEHVKPKFPLFDYIFDVVRDTKDHVYLLDFAPFNEKWSEPLAFEWDELTVDDEVIDDSDEDDDYEFRYLSTDCGIQPSKRNNYGIPKDVIDMFRASGNRTPEIDAPKTNGANSGTSQPSTNTLDDVINNRLEQVFRNQPDESDDESVDC